MIRANSQMIQARDCPNLRMPPHWFHLTGKHLLHDWTSLLADYTQRSITNYCHADNTI